MVQTKITPFMLGLLALFPPTQTKKLGAYGVQLKPDLQLVQRDLDFHIHSLPSKQNKVFMFCCTSLVATLARDR